MLFFVFKQKTAYEMRISDWSSDVCSSDLGAVQHRWPSERGQRRGGGHRRDSRTRDVEGDLGALTALVGLLDGRSQGALGHLIALDLDGVTRVACPVFGVLDRKSTRLNSRH